MTKNKPLIFPYKNFFHLFYSCRVRQFHITPFDDQQACKMSPRAAANDVRMPPKNILRALSLNTVCRVKNMALFCWENHQIYVCAETEWVGVVQKTGLTMLIGISE